MDNREDVLNEIYDNAELWELCWPLTDAYGEPGLMPPQGYDWSGFRDSSDEAVQAMAARLVEWRSHRTMEQLLAVPHVQRSRALQEEINRRLREASRRRVWGR